MVDMTSSLKTLTYESNGERATATYRRLASNGDVDITLSAVARIPEGDQYVTDYGFACVFTANLETAPVNISLRLVMPGTPLADQLQKILDGDAVITAIENIISLIRNGQV